MTSRKPDDLGHSHPPRVLSHHEADGGFVSREEFHFASLTSDETNRTFSVRVASLVGVALCPLPNRAHCRRRGQGERLEQLFQETWPEKKSPNSVWSVARSGRISRTSRSLTSPNVLNATRGFSSVAGASPTLASRTPCSARSLAKSKFQSALVPAMAADTTTAPDMTDPPVAVVVNQSRRVA